MKLIRVTLFSLAFLTTVANGTWSMAQDSAADVDALFQRLDKNGDGKVSASEIPEDQSRYFERLLRRANKDASGELTREEFRQASMPDARSGVTLSADPAQARADARERFERLDRNKDGKLTLDEVPEPLQDRLKPLFERSRKQELTLEDFTRMTAAMRPDPAEMFARLDTNSDGKLTIDEAPERARPMIESVLTQAGKERSGSLTKEEFVKNFAGAIARSGDGGRRPEGDRPAMERTAGAARESSPTTERRSDAMAQEGRGPMLFRLLDTNRDGHVSKEEFAKVADLFDQLDRNHDSQLDPLELAGPPPGAEVRRAGSQQAGMRRAESEASNPAGERNRNEIRQPFERLDRDGDGKISKDEAPEAMKERFSVLDTNGDGFVTRDELRAGARLPGAGTRSQTPERSRPE